MKSQHLCCENNPLAGRQMTEVKSAAKSGTWLSPWQRVSCDAQNAQEKKGNGRLEQEDEVVEGRNQATQPEHSRTIPSLCQLETRMCLFVVVFVHGYHFCNISDYK